MQEPRSVHPSDSLNILQVSAYAHLKGRSLAVSGTNATKAIEPGGFSIFTFYSPDCTVLCRFDGTATLADGGWSFVVPAGIPIDVEIDSQKPTDINGIAPTGSGALYFYPRI